MKKVLTFFMVLMTAAAVFAGPADFGWGSTVEDLDLTDIEYEVLSVDKDGTLCLKLSNLPEEFAFLEEGVFFIDAEDGLSNFAYAYYEDIDYQSDEAVTAFEQIADILSAAFGEPVEDDDDESFGYVWHSAIADVNLILCEGEEAGTALFSIVCSPSLLSYVEAALVDAEAI